MQRVYLDNAATSWPKPESVYAAVDHYQREIGAAAGRGGYRQAIQADQIVQRARAAAARLLNAADPKQVLFTTNCTDALNLALHGVLQPGDHVVTTVCEHNSVLRPLEALRAESDIEVSVVPCDGAGWISPDDVRGAVQSNTRLVAVSHVSNVTGVIQPVAEIGEIAAERKVFFLLDAAQSLGHIGVNVQELKVDLLATSGHKGLLGPLGTGLLYVRPGVEQSLQIVRQGGTGTSSHSERQPDELPEKYEAGNLNLPGLAGLLAGLEFTEDRSVDAISGNIRLRMEQLQEFLVDCDAVHVLGPTCRTNCLGVVSFNVEGYDPQDVAAVLDASYGVQARAGLHCAPRMHKALGTGERGAVRISPGYSTTSEDIDMAIAGLREMCSVTS